MLILIYLVWQAIEESWGRHERSWGYRTIVDQIEIGNFTQMLRIVLMNIVI